MRAPSGEWEARTEGEDNADETVGDGVEQHLGQARYQEQRRQAEV